MAEGGETVFRKRQAGREERGHAVGKLAAPDGVERLVRGVAEVETAAPVGMDVHEAGKERQAIGGDNLVPGARSCRRTADGVDAAVVTDAHVHHAEVASRRDDMRPVDDDGH